MGRGRGGRGTVGRSIPEGDSPGFLSSLPPIPPSPIRLPSLCLPPPPCPSPLPPETLSGSCARGKRQRRMDEWTDSKTSLAATRLREVAESQANETISEIVERSYMIGCFSS